MDPARQQYQSRRIAHWDRVSKQKEDTARVGAYYQEMLQDLYRFFIPPGMKVLELGSGLGELLDAVGPSVGVGVDFSGQMVRKAAEKFPELRFIQSDVQDLQLQEKFDFIILSDIVNDLWDVQAVLQKIRSLAHPRTRVILNFYNNLWRIPLGIVKRLNLGCDLLEQNWFAPNDIVNLLELAGFEVIHTSPKILLPIDVPFAGKLANRFLANIIPFQWLALTNFVVARPLTTAAESEDMSSPSVSVIVAARNEAGNIKNIIQRVPWMGGDTEIVFVEGGSSDNTFAEIEQQIQAGPRIPCRLFKQNGKGKGDAVQLGFQEAKGDVLMILDADLTVPPEDLPRFYAALVSKKGEFINGVRLVYPMEDEAMRFFNILGNKFFSIAFSWLLGQPIKDTLCGTKVLFKKDYEMISGNRQYFGDFDPFGDFDLLFGAAKLQLKIKELPIRYRERTYGDTNISRWRHGWLLLKMVVFAAKRIKFI